MTTPITPTPSGTSTVVDTSADREVAAGIEWLDEHRRRWPKRARLETLDLISPVSCLACQVACVKKFSHALKSLQIKEDEAAALGFLLPVRLRSAMFADMKAWYAAAESLWRAEILRRRSPDTTTPTGEPTT